MGDDKPSVLTTQTVSTMNQISSAEFPFLPVYWRNGVFTNLLMLPSLCFLGGKNQTQGRKHTENSRHITPGHQQTVSRLWIETSWLFFLPWELLSDDTTIEKVLLGAYTPS